MFVRNNIDTILMTFERLNAIKPNAVDRGISLQSPRTNHNSPPSLQLAITPATHQPLHLPAI